MKNTYAIIMAGGTGTRFWPYSRLNKPKQFLDILGIGKTLLQQTFERFNTLVPAENIYVVSNEQYKDLLKKQLPNVSSDQILLEPVKKNTAPCIAYAASKIASRDSKAKIIISPSDHAIFDTAKYYDAINTALKETDDDRLMTIGIHPTRPDTGYGYIQYKNTSETLKEVKTFTEKPGEDLAKKFIESGDYVWNAGIFITSAKAIDKAFAEFLPETHEAFEEIKDKFFTGEEESAIKSSYAQCRNISIDYGIMEKSGNVFVVLGDFQWVDLGSWNSLRNGLDKDDDGNLNRANSLLYNMSDSVIMSTDNKKLIVAEGLKGYVIADCGNALLICRQSNEVQMRQLVNDVKKDKGEDYL